MDMKLCVSVSDTRQRIIRTLNNLKLRIVVELNLRPCNCLAIALQLTVYKSKVSPIMAKNANFILSSSILWLVSVARHCTFPNPASLVLPATMRLATHPHTRKKKIWKVQPTQHQSPGKKTIQFTGTGINSTKPPPKQSCTSR
jgi:hypothetical protein